jgi:hypothetical protein
VTGPLAASGGSLSGVEYFELAVAGLLLLGGVRSLLRWMRTEFEPESTGEQALYLLYATARVGTWLAFAAFAAGYALVDEPQSFRWFFVVPVALGAIQLLTGLRLGLSARGESPDGVGRNPPMDTAYQPAGPFEPEKHGDTSEPGHPQPEAAEVESARVLANQAREELREDGLTDREIRVLADEFIALNRGEGLPEFVAWARQQPRLRDGV